MTEETECSSRASDQAGVPDQDGPEIRFYHLQRSGVEDTLPPLLEKALARGMRAVVRVDGEARLNHLDEWLWTYRKDGFLPHGRDGDPHAQSHPVWLTQGDDRPNEASLLIVTDGHLPPEGHPYALICDVFDGRFEATVEAARGRWKAYRERGGALSYWQQTAGGGWERKA